MATRTISGVITVKADHQRGGNATIFFNPHSVSGDINRGSTSLERLETGPARRFNRTPSKVVSLRRIEAADKTSGRAQSRGWNINDGINRDKLDVTWSTYSGSFVREISYLVIGEV